MEKSSQAIFSGNSVYVSIVISVYKTERIKDVMDALLGLEYDKEFEIILVADGCAETGLKIMKEYEKKFSRIRVFAQKNAGAAKGRNLGISKSRGKYIVVTDDDVLLEKEWLKKSVPIIEKEDGFVCSIIKNPVPKNLTKLNHLLFDYAMASRTTNQKNEGSMFMTNIFRASTLKKLGSYNGSFRGAAAGADVELLMRYYKNNLRLLQSDAVATHLEEKDRFQLGFFLKKPYYWGQTHLKVVMMHGPKYFPKYEFFLYCPVSTIVTLIFIFLIFINWFFLLLFLLPLIVYIHIRRPMIKLLIQRKRNFFEIAFVCCLDIMRGYMYNFGALKYFFTRKID